MEIRNLTPHEVKVLADDGSVIGTFPSVGVARARQTDTPVGLIESIPVVKTGFGEVTGLPEPTEGVAFIVSIITLNAARAHGRSTDDLLITSQAVRDDQGRIVGCRAFARA